MHKHTKFVLSLGFLAVLAGTTTLHVLHHQTASVVGTQLIAKSDEGQGGGQDNGGGNDNDNGGGNAGDNGGGNDNGNAGGNGGGNDNGNAGGNGGGNDNDNAGGNGNGLGDGVGGGRDHAPGQQKKDGGSVENHAGDNGRGASDKTSTLGRGLRQHAAVLHHVLRLHGVHDAPAHTYMLKHPNVHPASFASHSEEEAWGEHLHKVSCSMFRYLLQLREANPGLRVDYADWIVNQVAHALNEDPVEVKAALLGYGHRHARTHSSEGAIEIGCARSEDELSAIEKEDFAEEHSLHEHAVETAERFVLDDQSTDKDIIFRVLEDGEVFNTYGVSHTKEMHLLIVRDDLRHFSHIHPERDASGTWRVPFAPEVGGTYWFYADFVDSDIKHYTLRFTRTYAGDPGQTGFVPNLDMRKRMGKYVVSLETASYSEGTLFTYHINDYKGESPLLEPYLGAMGHGILISPSGDFIHTHPSPAGDNLTFNLPNPLEGIYRIFAQVQIAGEVQTVEFDLLPDEKK